MPVLKFTTLKSDLTFFPAQCCTFLFNIILEEDTFNLKIFSWLFTAGHIQYAKTFFNS